MKRRTYEVCELPSGRFALIETVNDDADVRLGMDGDFEGDTFATREAAELERRRREQADAKSHTKAA
jgi:hypothetical protein